MFLTRTILDLSFLSLGKKHVVEMTRVILGGGIVNVRARGHPLFLLLRTRNQVSGYPHTAYIPKEWYYTCIWKHCWFFTLEI